MNSQWLEGTVRHRRKYPVQHEFSYSTGMLALDTDEWGTVARVSPLFSLERFNWMSLKRRDYFRPDTEDLSVAVRDHPSPLLRLCVQPGQFLFLLPAWRLPR